MSTGGTGLGMTESGAIASVTAVLSGGLMWSSHLIAQTFLPPGVQQWIENGVQGTLALAMLVIAMKWMTKRLERKERAAEQERERMQAALDVRDERFNQMVKERLEETRDYNTKILTLFDRLGEMRAEAVNLQRDAKHALNNVNSTLQAFQEVGVCRYRGERIGGKS